MNGAVARVIGEADAWQNDALAEAEDKFVKQAIEMLHQDFIAFRTQALRYGGIDFPALTPAEAEERWKLVAVRNGIWKRR